MSKFSRWVSQRWGDGPSMDGLASSVKGTGRFAGKVGQYAAPIISVANPMLGAGIAAGSAALRGKSVGDMLKEAAITGASGYALGKVGGFLGAGAGGEADGIVESMADVGARSAVPAASVAAKTAAPSLASRVGGFAKDNWKDLAIGGGHVAGALLQNNANNAQLSFEQRRYDDEQRRRTEEQARMDPVRQMLLQWVQQRMGQSGFPK